MWARIENGKVCEIIYESPHGRFHSDIVWVECPDESVLVGFDYDEWSFTPPKVDVSAVNSSLVGSLMAEASGVISILSDAVDLGMASPSERELYDLWRKYRVELSRVDQSVHPMVLPQKPQ